MEQYDINSEAPAYLPIEGVKGPHVLLSIEELREMWDAAVQKGWEDTKRTKKEVNGFRAYLQSKDIELP